MIRISLTCLLLLILGCAQAQRAWNDPRHADSGKTTRYHAFSGPPKTLDPARAYSSDELQFIGQIYEPPLQYHYLKRPYELEPLTATQMPTVTYLNKKQEVLPQNAPNKAVAYTRYTITIKPGIRYQPHPAFYWAGSPDQVGGRRRELNNLPDRMTNLLAFPHMQSRELTAADYVYQIKRLASPTVNSPIYGIMSHYIVGLKTLRQQLLTTLIKHPKAFLNLNHYSLTGVTIDSKYQYSILIKGKYPQFIYWLAMPFFAPAPWEADAFYAQPGMKERNLTWDWFPVGTGPYRLAINNPNQKMVLQKNPNFHGEKFPSAGSPDQVGGRRGESIGGRRGEGIGENDKTKSPFLHSPGEDLPFIDTVIFLLDKESIPRWNKFLQGYYDVSGVSADSFDQAIQIGPDGKPILTPELKKMGLRLQISVHPSIFYIGFNMLDPIVGGKSERARLLRQAISIVIDYEEYIALFHNGRGKTAHGPIPPGIFGYEDGASGINPYTFIWKNGSPQRRSLTEAKELLTQAGYINGIDPKTQHPLVLHYDTTGTGSPEDKSHYLWLKRQFSKLGIELNIRATQYNRFRDKVRTGQAQLFSWGWNADYPDPENFLFLLYGKNGKVKHGGENATNYDNKAANALFETIRYLPNGPERQQKINQLLAILRHDSPMIWGFHPINYTLSHAWNAPAKSHAVAQNTLKYQKVSSKKREERIRELNKPALWPFIFSLAFIIVLGVPLIFYYHKKHRQSQIKRY